MNVHLYFYFEQKEHTRRVIAISWSSDDDGRSRRIKLLRYFLFKSKYADRFEFVRFLHIVLGPQITKSDIFQKYFVCLRVSSGWPLGSAFFNSTNHPRA